MSEWKDKLLTEADNMRLKVENKRLRVLAQTAVSNVCFDCPHRLQGQGSCKGCNIYEMATELGVETGWRWSDEQETH